MHTSAARRNSTHPAIPTRGTWSITTLINPSSPIPKEEEELTDDQLDKLHRLSALIPPSSSEQRTALKRELDVMLRLVRGVLPTADEKGGMVDARPLSAHDGRWNVTLHPTPKIEADDERTKLLDRDTELLGKVDDERSYQSYFVVNRT